MARKAGSPSCSTPCAGAGARPLIIALLFALGSTIYVESLPSQYDGNALLSIAPRPEVSDVSGNVVRIVGPKYSEYAKARATIRDVAPTLGEDPKKLERATVANIVTDTGNVTIRVRLPSPERAAAAANAIARKTVEFSRTDPLLSAQIVAPALPDDEVAAPPRRILEAAALFIGILIGIVASLLLERGRPRLRNWRDLARTSGYPVLGRIPPLRSLKNRPTGAFVDGEASSAARILRANLEPQIREGAIDFIVVTSASPGDGKTTIAAMLAESFSRLGMKVLVIDADLRRPGLSRITGVDAVPGLSTVLREEASLDQAIREGLDRRRLAPADGARRRGRRSPLPQLRGHRRAGARAIRPRSRRHAAAALDRRPAHPGDDGQGHPARRLRGRDEQLRERGDPGRRGA